jgi:hypothetical protein
LRSRFELQGRDLQFRAAQKVSCGRAALNTVEALEGNRGAFGCALRTLDQQRHILDYQFGSFELRALAGKLIGEEQRFFDDTGERPETQVDGAHASSALARDFFFGSFDNAQCD